MTIHERLRMLDARKIISIKEISEAMDIQERTVSNWFSGTVKNIPHTLFAYLQEHKIEVNLKWLLLGEGEMLNKENKNYATKTAIPMKVKDENNATHETETIKKLASVIEQLTMQINELPALRERISILEKELQNLKRY